MLTLKIVNQAIAALPSYTGEILVKGEGYYYFTEGNAMDWSTSSVYTYRLNHLTLQHWIDSYLRLQQDQFGGV